MTYVIKLDRDLIISYSYRNISYTKWCLTTPRQIHRCNHDFFRLSTRWSTLQHAELVDEDKILKIVEPIIYKNLRLIIHNNEKSLR